MPHAKFEVGVSMFSSCSVALNKLHTMCFFDKGFPASSGSGHHIELCCVQVVAGPLKFVGNDIVD